MIDYYTVGAYRIRPDYTNLIRVGVFGRMRYALQDEYV